MKKKEFLEILMRTLKHEVSDETIEQHIRYYDQYIGSQSSSLEEEIIKELGDPRLIAKTIIEAEKAAKNNHRYSNTEYREERNSSSWERGRGASAGTTGQGGSNNFSFTHLKWYHKLIFWCVMILIILLLVFVFKFLIGILVAFGVPIFLVILLYYIVKKNR